MIWNPIGKRKRKKKGTSRTWNATFLAVFSDVGSTTVACACGTRTDSTEVYEVN